MNDELPDELFDSERVRLDSLPLQPGEFVLSQECVDALLRFCQEFLQRREDHGDVAP